MEMCVFAHLREIFIEMLNAAILFLNWWIWIEQDQSVFGGMDSKIVWGRLFYFLFLLFTLNGKIFNVVDKFFIFRNAHLCVFICLISFENVIEWISIQFNDLFCFVCGRAGKTFIWNSKADQFNKFEILNT